MATVQPQLFTPEVLKPDFSVPVLPAGLDVRAMTQKSINFDGSRDVYVNALQPTIPLDGSQITTLYVNSDGTSMMDMDNTNIEFNFKITTASAVKIFQFGQFFDQCISYVNDQQESLRIRVSDTTTLMIKTAPKQHMSNGYYGRPAGDTTDLLNTFNPNVEYKVSMPIKFFTGLGGNKAIPMFGPIKSVRFDLKWNSPNAVFTCPIAPQATITNIRLVSRFIKVDSVVRDALVAEWMRNGRIQFLGTNWGVNILQLPSTSAGSQQSVVLNHNYTRPKSLMVVCKDASKTGFADVKNCFISVADQAYWLINGATVPNLPIKAYESDELLYQLDRVFGKSSGLQTAYYGVNHLSLTETAPSDEDHNDCASIIAYDTEIVHNLSSTMVSLGGNGSNSQFVLTRNDTNDTNNLELLSIVPYEYLLDVNADGSIKTYQ
jgi:hypothetical protein